MKVKKAVIMAAGYGTRFLPFSKAVSKTMLPIVDMPTIEMVCKEAVDSGIEEILIIVGKNKQSIIDHFKEDKDFEKRVANKPEFVRLLKTSSAYNVNFVEQTVINGTGGALLLAEDFTKNEPFLLMFADDLMVNDKYPISKQIIDVFEKTGKMVLAVQNVRREDVPKYSSVEYSSHDDRAYNVTQVVEKPKLEDVKSTLSTLGRYVFTSEIYSYCKKLEPSSGGELCITDSYTPIARELGLIAYDFDGTRYDIGNKFGYITAVVDSALKNPEFGEKLKEYLKNKIN